MDAKPPSIDKLEWRPQSSLPRVIRESGSWFVDGKTTTTPASRETWNLVNDVAPLRDSPVQDGTVEIITEPVVEAEASRELPNIPEYCIALSHEDSTAGLTLQQSDMCSLQ